jgi:hypothetical protein
MELVMPLACEAVEKPPNLSLFDKSSGSFRGYATINHCPRQN